MTAPKRGRSVGQSGDTPGASRTISFCPVVAGTLLAFFAFTTSCGDTDSAHTTLRSSRIRFSIDATTSASSAGDRLNSRLPVRVAPANVSGTPAIDCRLASASAGSCAGAAASACRSSRILETVSAFTAGVTALTSSTSKRCCKIRRDIESSRDRRNTPRRLAARGGVAAIVHNDNGIVIANAAGIRQQVRFRIDPAHTQYGSKARQGDVNVSFWPRNGLSSPVCTVQVV